MLGRLLRLTIAFAVLAGVAGQSRRASAVASAELYTVAAYRYGRFRARVQFPTGDGVVGSFFLWKNGSEMPNVFWNELDFEKFGANCALQFNAIFGLPRGDQPSLVNAATAGCAVYRTYGYEWTPDHIAWSVDGTELRRDTGVAAQAYADQAAQGMQIRFNLWPGTPAFGGTFSESILPVQQFVSWVEYSTFTPGTGDGGGEFTLIWRESFENGIPADWAEGNWVSAASLSTHSLANVTTVAGIAVLSLTADNATGFTGPPPVDPGDLPSARGSMDGGLPAGPDAGPNATDASAADGTADTRIDAQTAPAGDSAPTDTGNPTADANAAAPSDAAPDRADAGATSIVDAASSNSADATSREASLAETSSADQPDGTVPPAEAASNPAGAADASATADAAPSTDADSPVLSEAAANSSADRAADSAVNIDDGSTAGDARERRLGDQNGCGCRLSVASGPSGEDHFLAVAFLACAASTWSRRRRRRRAVAS